MFWDRMTKIIFMHHFLLHTLGIKISLERAKFLWHFMISLAFYSEKIVSKRVKLYKGRSKLNYLYFLSSVTVTKSHLSLNLSCCHKFPLSLTWGWETLGLHLNSLWGIHWSETAKSLPSLWIEASLREALLVTEASLCLDQSPKCQQTFQAKNILYCQYSGTKE